MHPANVITVDSINESIDRVFLLPKPTKKEKGEYNNHRTVKPIALCEYLIAISTQENAIILDSFAGSGTTLVVAQNLNRKYICIELNERYVDIANRRLRELGEKANSNLFSFQEYNVVL